MTFAAALRLLEARKETRIRLGLARMRRHLRRLGDPQEGCPVVQVAGTNGKGSVCAMLDSILRRAGLRVGFYLSPHIEDVRERIRVDGRWISPAALARALARAKSAEKGEPLTYFELLTSAAFQHFRDRRVGVAVLETGLGGRLDATNVARRPLACLVTTIGRDHMNFLGAGLSSIAREKAGIFRRGCHALTSERRPLTLRVLKRCARRAGAVWRALPRRSPWRAEKVDWILGRQVLRGPSGRLLELGLLGCGQARNVELALETVASLRERGLDIPERAVAEGLARVRWPGRFDVREVEGRTLILDGAHNVQAMEHFTRTLGASPWRKVPKLFILGFLSDKPYRGMLRLLAPWLGRVMAVRPPSPRALEPSELARELRIASPRASVLVLGDPAAALSRWRNSPREPRVACVCGSFYLVARALEALPA